MEPLEINELTELGGDAAEAMARSRKGKLKTKRIIEDKGDLAAVLFKGRQDGGQGIDEPSFKIAWKELPKKLRKSEYLATEPSNNKYEGIYRRGEKSWIAKFNGKGLFKKMRRIQADEMADTELRFEVDIDGDGFIGPAPMPEPPLPEKLETPETVPSPSSGPADTTRPNATISSDADGSTNGDVTFTITFTEAVNGLTAEGISVSNATKGAFTKVDGRTYTLVGTPTANSSGTITVEVMANAARDAAGNGNTASEPFNQPFDTAAPGLSINSSVAGIANGEVTYTFLFTEAVMGFDATDVTLTGATAGNFSAVSDSEYTIVVTPAANSTGTIGVAVAADAATDVAGNGNTAATSTPLPFDTEAPTLIISSPTDPTEANDNDALISFTFSEAVTDFVETDVILTGSVTAGVFTRIDAANYTLEAIAGPDRGPFSVMVGANAAFDQAGNGNIAAELPDPAAATV